MRLLGVTKVRLVWGASCSRNLWTCRWPSQDYAKSALRRFEHCGLLQGAVAKAGTTYVRAQLIPCSRRGAYILGKMGFKP